MQTMRYFLLVVAAAVVATRVDGNTVERTASKRWEQYFTLRDDSSKYTVNKPAGGWMVSPIHSTLLPSGKVMMLAWVRRDEHKCESATAFGGAYVVDPKMLVKSTLQSPIHMALTPLDEKPEIFNRDIRDAVTFSGHAMLPKGKMFFYGGSRLRNGGDWSEGLDYARVFDSRTLQFERVQYKAPIGKAWYPTAVTLPDQRIMVLAAFTRVPQRTAAMAFFNFERHENKLSNPWDLIYQNHESRQDITPVSSDYGRIYVLPIPVNVDGYDRQVVAIGEAGRVVFMNTDQFFPISHSRFADRPQNHRPGGCGYQGTSALLATGEVMLAGGCRKNKVDLYNPVTDSWRTVTVSPRSYGTAVLLANGMVLFINGEGDVGQTTRPELYDPFSDQVTLLDQEPGDSFKGVSIRRSYHNVASLLHDGSILIGGGTHHTGWISCENPSIRIFNPTYMQKNRPQLNVRAADAGKELELQLDDPTSSLTFKMQLGSKPLYPSSGAPGSRSGASLLAVSAITHSFDQNQRYVPLEYSTSGDEITVFAPRQPQAVPGAYILSIVDTDGVPSVSLPVQVLPATGQWTRTVIYVQRGMPSTSRMYISGGHSAVSVQQYFGDSSEVVIHRNLLEDVVARRTTTRLNWNQESSMSWTCKQDSCQSSDYYTRSGLGIDFENMYGTDYWKFEVFMKTTDAADPAYKDWFEFSVLQRNADGSEIKEGDIAHVTTEGPSPPIRSAFHWAKKGHVNIFQFDKNEATILPLNELPVTDSMLPIDAPTPSPTLSPTKNPTKSPTVSPTASPTKTPTSFPTKSPTTTPTKLPTASPTKLPDAVSAGSESGNLRNGDSSNNGETKDAMGSIAYIGAGVGGLMLVAAGAALLIVKGKRKSEFARYGPQGAPVRTNTFSNNPKYGGHVSNFKF